MTPAWRFSPFLCSLLLVCSLFTIVHGVEYKIALLTAKTGSKDSAKHVQCAKAANMAAAEINAAWAPGDQLTILDWDTQNDGAKTLQLALNAANDAQVMAVIGAGADEHVRAAAQLLSNYPVPMLSPTMRAPVGTTNFYSSAPDFGHPAKVVQSMLERYNWNQVGIVHTAEAESVALKDAILDLPGVTSLQTVEIGLFEKDYLKTLQALVGVSVNIYIYIVPNNNTMTKLLRDTAAAGGFYTGPKAFFYLNQAPEVDTELQGGFIVEETDGLQVGAWGAYLGEKPISGSATTYDTVMAIAHAIERLKASSTVTRANMRSELANTDENGFSGPLSYTPDRFRAVKTYNVSNVVSSNPMSGFVPGPPPPHIERVAFVYDGTLTQVEQVIWPGNVSAPTPGNVTTYPVAFLAPMYNNMNEMIAAQNVVPMTAARLRPYLTLCQRILNEEIMPVDARISGPPLNDSGTVKGSTQTAANMTASTYVAMIATYGSRNTKIMQGIWSAFNLPHFSYGAGDPTLSDKNEFPSFGRLYPSDAKQIAAMIELIRGYGWTQVGIMSSTSSYGQTLEKVFLEQLAAVEGFTPGTKVIVDTSSDLTAALKMFKDSRTNVLVLLLDNSFYVPVRLAMNAADYHPGAVLGTDPLVTPLLWSYRLQGSGLTMADFRGWIGFVPAGGFENTRFETVLKPQAAAYIDSNTASFAAYIFDSYHAVTEGILKCRDLDVDPLNGIEFLNVMRTIQFEGVTGHIAFDNNLDRVNNPFLLQYLDSNGNVTLAATWDESAGLHFRSLVVWPDGTTDVPIAVEPRKVTWLKYSSPGGIVLMTIAAIGLAICIAMMVLTFLWRAAPIILSSTYPFLLLILFGAGLGFGSMFTWIGEPARWICALRIWLPPLAFSLMLAPLLAKTWRLHRIFSLTTLETTPIPLWKLIIMVICLVVVQVGICIAWISAGTIDTEVIPDKHNSAQAFKICKQTNANRICSYVTYGYLGLLLVVGAYYAFRVRNLPKDFNESRWIGFSIYNTLLFSVIIVILGYSLTDFKVTVLLLICVCTLAITFGVVMFMMTPKIFDLIMHPDRRSGSGSISNGSNNTYGSKRGTSSTTSWRSDDSPRGPVRRHDYSLKRMPRTNDSRGSKSDKEDSKKKSRSKDSKDSSD